MQKSGNTGNYPLTDSKSAARKGVSVRVRSPANHVYKFAGMPSRRSIRIGLERSPEAYRRSGKRRGTLSSLRAARQRRRPHLTRAMALSYTTRYRGSKGKDRLRSRRPTPPLVPPKPSTYRGSASFFSPIHEFAYVYSAHGEDRLPYTLSLMLRSGTRMRTW